MTIARPLAAPLVLAALALAAPAPSRAAGPLDTFDSAPGGRGHGRGAQSPGTVAPARFVFQVGYDAGRFESGFIAVNDKGSGTGLHLNSGVNVATGINLSFGNGGPGGVQVTAGIEYASISAGGDKLLWIAVPIESIGYLQLNPIRVGIGASMLVGSAIKSEGRTPEIDLNFDFSTGWVFELGWVAPITGSARGAQTSLGIRYVVQDLSASGTSIEADSFGAVINFTL